MDDWYCSERSLSAHEPLEGTAAPGVEYIIALEHDVPYGPKGLEDSGLPPEALARLTALTKRHPHVRVQLIRRPSARTGPLGLYVSGGPEGEERLWRVELDSAAEILDIDLDAWLAGTPDPASVELEGPLFLVCVHGRRDRCCARKGMPVFSAIERAAPDDTFQTTHLGGHRFAATLVVLPAGICYGRVNPEEGEALVRAHRAGRLHDLERMRGRMRFAQSVQSAEIALRRALGVMGVSDLRYLGAVSEDGHTRCEFRELASGVTHTIRVHEQALAPIAPSCGADPKPGEAWVELRLH